MPQIVIQPFDQAIQQAVSRINQLDPNLLKGVQRIIVMPGSGTGVLGFVESGPNKNPYEIKIYKERIRENVMKNSGVTTKMKLTQEELNHAFQDALLEVLVHESKHISGKVPDASRPFYGEPEAERGAKELMRKIKPANSTFKLSKRAKAIIDLRGGRVESAVDNKNEGFDERLTGLKVRTTTWPDADAELTGNFYVRGADNDLRLKVIYTGESSLGDPHSQYVPLIYITLLSNIEITWEPDEKERLSINTQRFYLSKRATEMEMACPSCYEDISNITPEKNEAGLYKMMTCPSCKNSFYPQDALLAVKHREKQKTDIGTWRERGWWAIWFNGCPLGFVNDAGQANLIKSRLVDIFAKNGTEPLGVIGSTIEGILNNQLNEILGGQYIEVAYSDIPEYSQYEEPGNEAEAEINSILSGQGSFYEKMRKDFLEKAIGVGKAPKNFTPRKESIISGSMPTEKTWDSSEYDIQTDGKEEHMSGDTKKEFQEDAQKSMGYTEDAVRKLISGPLSSASKKIKAIKDGIDPSTLCDDSVASKKKVNDFISNSALYLEEIREKFLPNYVMAEPTMGFATLVANNDKNLMVRYGISLIKNANEKSIITEINEAQQFNRNVLEKHSNIKLYPRIAQLLPNYNDYDLIMSIANWQYKNNLSINGKLDEDTIKVFPHQSFNSKVFPRNFGVVVPGKLYRGGLISDEGQIESLRNLGIQRVVSLHSNPDVARLCNSGGIEYVPAFIENGSQEDLGRKIFGESVSKFLLQKPTYVHCFFGEDRTGGVIARFRTETGWPCKLAYAEAKSYGFKDIFVDLIDWFSEFCMEKPINTDKIRKALKSQPYQNPEILSKEQECSLPTPAPNDVPFEDSEPTSFPSYKSYITSEIPTSFTIPFSVSSSLKNAQESNVESKDIEEEIEENPEEQADDMEPAVNIVGLQEAGIEQNMNSGISLEPFFGNIGNLG